jgi:YD repeat-containing protein
LVNLAPGVYTVTIKAYGSIAEAEATITYIPGEVANVTKDWPVGGVRVKQVMSYSSDKKNTGKTRYLYHAVGSSISNAILQYNIQYSKDINFDNYCNEDISSSGPPVHLNCSYRSCSYASLFSSALTNLFMNAGNSVSYPVVLQSFDNVNGNGLIEHKFMINSDAAGQLLLGNTILGETPTNTSIFYQGKEMETTYYTSTGSTYIPARRTHYYYSSHAQNYSEVTACIVNKLFNECIINSSGPVQPYELAPYEATRYTLYAPWVVLDSLVEQNYTTDGSQVLKSSTVYLYDSTATLLPSITRTKDSRGRQEETTSYYSGMDGSIIPGISSDQVTFAGTLKNKNVLTELLYQQRTLNSSFNGSYRMALNQFSPSNLVLTKNVKDLYINGVDGKSFFITSYDAVGNILERSKDDGVIYSYIYDYNNNYPIAEAAGADRTSIAATSFEADGWGNWTYTGTIAKTNDATSPTGKRYGNFSSGSSLSKSGLSNTGSYILSYWYKGGATTVSAITGSSNAVTVAGKDGWMQVIMKISGVTSVSLAATGPLDEVRLYPEGAKMITYTYNPLIGISSVADSNSTITYYEYDEFGRLTVVRDAKGKVLKAHQYQYAITATTPAN